MKTIATISIVAGIQVTVFSGLLCGSITGPQLHQAKTFYYEGVNGNESAEKQSDKIFSTLYGQMPGDPLISVYYGSLRLVEAKHTCYGVRIRYRGKECN